MNKRWDSVPADPQAGYILNSKLMQLRKWPPLKTVFTNGCFDILHPGHIRLLQLASHTAGPYGAVVIGVNDDKSVRRLKGASRPLTPIQDRIWMLENVTARQNRHWMAIPFSEDTPFALMQAVRPHVIIKGGDYTVDQVVGHEYADVVIQPLIIGYSTTSIADRINA